MKFGLIFETLLLEMSGDEIYEKYYSDKLTKQRFNKIVSYDPATKIVNGRIEKVGRYSKILLNIFLSGNMVLEDLPNAKDYLTYAYKHNVPLDIKEIRYIPDIYNKINKYKVYENKDLNDILKSLSKDEYKIEHNGDKWAIFIPLTVKASCYLGVNAEWCTTWGPESLTPSLRGRTNHFKKYNSKGELYIIINKNDPTEKYQFHFENEEFKNRSNSDFNHKKLINDNIELKRYFFPSLFGLVGDIEKEIKYFDLIGDEEISKIIYVHTKDNKNNLVNSILSFNWKNIVKYVEDDVLVHSEGIDIDSNKFLEFQIRHRYQSDIINNVYETISDYERDQNNAHDEVKRDFWEVVGEIDEPINCEMWADWFKEFIKNYYKTKKNDINSKLGINNYEQLENNYLKLFLNDMTLFSKWSLSVIDVTSEEYENRLEDIIGSIAKYIKITTTRGYLSVNVDIPHFVLYLIRNNIKYINGNLNEVLDGYIETFVKYYEYEPEGISITFPTYENYGDNVFDDFISEFNDYDEKDDDSGDVNFKIDIYRYFHKIKDEYFKNGTFENNEIVFKLLSDNINYKEETVYVSYLNKKTNKKYEGNVKIENIINYLQNYKLFESYITFKRVI